jgi:hypothetical protein
MLKFWFILVSFVTVPKTMPGLHLMHRFGPETKRCTSSGRRRNERTESTFLDPIVMFWIILVSFIRVPEIMSGLHLMHQFGPENETMHQFGSETKRMHRIHFFGHNSDVLVHFGQFHYCAKNHAGVAFNAPVRAGYETMHRFGTETK